MIFLGSFVLLTKFQILSTGSQILTGSKDSTSHKLDFFDGFPQITKHFQSPLDQVKLSNDNQIFVSNSSEFIIQDSDYDSVVYTYSSAQNNIVKASLSPCGKYAVVSLTTNTFLVDISTGQETSLFGLKQEKITAMHINYPIIIVATDTNMVLKYNIEKRKNNCIKTIQEVDSITALTFDIDENLIIGFAHGQIKHQSKDGKLITDQSLNKDSLHQGKVNSVSVGENKILSGGDDGNVHVYQIPEKKFSFKFLIGKPIKSIDMNSHDTFGVFGLEDGSVELWNLKERKMEWMNQVHKDQVISVSLKLF